MERVFEYKSMCSGCSACADVCALGAITMEFDELGFAYPAINQEKCVSCGLCRKTCHMINDLPRSPALETYAVQCKDKVLLGKCQSGGAFSVLAGYILEAGGAVYGAAFTDGFRVRHIRVDSREGLSRLRGSKYVQSDTEGIFQKVQSDLESQITVLFSGTPCQIAGLRSFLGKDYPGLYTAELICHGVLPPKLWGDYIGYISEKHGEIEYAAFREKSLGWHNCDERFKVGEKYLKKSIYRKIFYRDILLRPSCYAAAEDTGEFYVSCRYAGENRTADITLGDFWGIEKYSARFADDNAGVSVFMANTEKGCALFGKVAEEFFFEKREPDEVVPKNPHMRRNGTKIDKSIVTKAQSEYITRGFGYIAGKYGEAGACGILPKGIRFLKRIAGKIVK